MGYKRKGCGGVQPHCQKQGFCASKKAEEQETNPIINQYSIKFQSNLPVAIIFEFFLSTAIKSQSNLPIAIKFEFFLSTANQYSIEFQSNLPVAIEFEFFLSTAIESYCTYCTIT